MITTPATSRPTLASRKHRLATRRPRSLAARGLLPIMVLAIVLLPGFAAGLPCQPGLPGCPAPPPVLVVPDCDTPPGLTAPPSALVPLTALPSAVVPAVDAGQLLPGAGSVSATGEYQYRIPIDVPAGRAGMQPSLALAYGSRGRNGHVGVGWQLQGISEINRCAKTFATERYADGVHMDKTDSFCLDGQTLIAISGNYGEEGTEYRTEEDPFARIRSHATSAGGVTGFTVETRDGRLCSYASPGPSSGSLPVAAWPIQEERDRSGNSILYSYSGSAVVNPLHPDVSTVEYYPSRIDYNTITVNKVAQSGPRSVQFAYEGRLDTSTAYVGTAKVKTSQRLKSILLSAPNPINSEIVWRYDLEYEPGPASAASRLISVTRCSVNPDKSTGGCFAKKKFAWNQDLAGPKYSSETIPAKDPSGASFLVGDFFGNGQSELLRSDGATLRETIDPAHNLSVQIPCLGLLPGTDLQNAKVVDIRANGHASIVAGVSSPNSISVKYYIIDVKQLCSFVYTPVLPLETGVLGGSTLNVIDLNGDGFPDLVKGDADLNPDWWSWHYWLNTTQPSVTGQPIFGPKLSAPLVSPAISNDLTLEFSSFSRDDGNHRGILLAATDHANGNLVGFHLSATGTAQPADASLSVHPGYQSWNQYSDGHLDAYADTDGDGIRNVVSFDKDSIHFETTSSSIDWQGLDSSDLAEWRLESADFDSDGRDDLLLVHTTGDRKVLLFQNDAQAIIHESLAPFLAPSAIGDFDGDGLLDVVVDGVDDTIGPTYTVHHQIGPGTTDRIIAVNDQGDPGDSDPQARESIRYSNSQFYPGSCTYPQHCVGEGFAVVAEHDVYEGAEVQGSGSHLRRQLFNYEDARADRRGRGFLGFGIVRQWDPDRGAETTTTYDNAATDDNGIHLVYPGALRPKTVLRVLPMNGGAQLAFPTARLEQTTYVNQLDRLDQGQTYFVHPSSWQTLEWEETVTVNYLDTPWIHITDIDGVAATPTHGVASPLRRRDGSTTYDAYGNVLVATETTLNGLTSTTDTKYNYDTTNWLLHQLRSTDVTSYGTGMSVPTPQHKDYDYDTHARGLLCHVYTEQQATDHALTELVTFTHDQEGLLTAITSSAYGQPLRTMHMAYDPAERVYASETWNDLGQASFQLFDQARGFPLASEDANGLTAQRQYDDVGRVIHSEASGQASVEINYKARTAPNGAVIGTSSFSSSATGAKSRTDQDSQGRVVGSAHLGFDGHWIEEATSYDLFGRVALVTRPDFGAPSLLVTTFTYDNLDRPLTRVVPGGGTVSFTHQFLSTERVDTFTDRLTVRDLDDRVIQSVEDAAGAHLTTTFAYDEFNRLQTITDPATHPTQIQFDVRGRRTSVVDPDTGTTSFSYDGLGDVVAQTVGGSLTTYVYDTLGRLVGTNHGSEWTINTWDTQGAGRLAHTVSPDAVEQDFSYNQLGQLAKLTYTIDGESFAIGTTYDPFGRVTNLTYPTTPGMAKPFSVGKAYNPWGYLGSVYDPTNYSNVYWRADTRNASGQLTQATLGDTTTATRSYWPTTGLLSTANDGKAVALSYDYYADGSLKSLDDAITGRAERFGYDVLHRLVSWSYLAGQPEIDYHYDGIGNLAEVWTRPLPLPSSPATLKEHNTYSPTQPHALTAGPLGAYTYDSRGRQLTAPGRSNVTYNERDLPISLTPTGGVKSTFEYDASGARVKKQIASTETVLTLSGLYERHKKGTSTFHVFNIPGGEEGPVAQVVYTEALSPVPASTVVRYLHHEPRLGSVAAVTNTSGKVTESFYYDPFGRRTNKLSAPLANGTIDVPAGFTGHDHDDELGLVNMRGRMYDPTIRRFLSADPHVTDPLSGQSYNRYSYVLNNPTNRIDPTGFDDETWDFGGGSWNSDSGCIGQECAGGTLLTTSPADYGYGGYSGKPSTGTSAGGNGGSTVRGGGYGTPLAASEQHRQVSVPTGPAAPGGSIVGPQDNDPGANFHRWLAADTIAREIQQQRLANNGNWGDPDHDIAWIQENCVYCASAYDGLNAAGTIILAANDLTHLEDVARDIVNLATRGIPSTVSIWKAPQFGKGSAQFETGYQPKDFPAADASIPPAYRSADGGKAFFATTKPAADEYARSYGDGVIEVKVPSITYERDFRPLERPLLGTPYTELPVPHELFPSLNSSERIWHQ